MLARAWTLPGKRQLFRSKFMSPKNRTKRYLKKGNIMHSGISGFILAISLMIMSMLMGGGSHYFNLPCLLVTLGVGSGLTMLSFGIKDYNRSIKSLRLLFVKSMRDAPTERSITVLQGMIKFVYIGGLFGLLIGWIAILNYMTDPSSFGSGIAVSLLTLLYSIIISEFFLRPTIYRIKTELEKQGK